MLDEFGGGAGAYTLWLKKTEGYVKDLWGTRRKEHTHLDVEALKLEARPLSLLLLVPNQV